MKRYLLAHLFVALMVQDAFAACVITCTRGTDTMRTTNTKTCMYIDGLPRPLLPIVPEETLPQQCARIAREMDNAPTVTCKRDWAPNQTCAQLGLPNGTP